jgi:hypothetical protein
VDEDSADVAADSTPEDDEREHDRDSHEDAIDIKDTTVGNNPELTAIKDEENIENSWSLLDQPKDRPQRRLLGY